MPLENLIALSLLIFAIAILYSCVGHAGASGYIAVMTLFNLGVNAIKPMALILNIGVSILAFAQFYRAGFFQWTLFGPLPHCLCLSHF